MAVGLATGQLSMNCMECTRNPVARKEWGCEEPAPFPVFTIDRCVECRGLDKNCEHCDGKGEEDVFECPIQLLARNGANTDWQQLLVAYGRYKNNMLPVAGGWLDQSVTFLKAMEIIDQEVAEWRASQQRKK